MFKKSRIWFYYGIWQFEHALEGVISTYKDSFQGWLSSRSRAPTYYELVRLRLTRSVGGCTLPTTKHPLKESLYVEKTPSHASKPPNPIVKSNSLFFKHIIVISAFCPTFLHCKFSNPHCTFDLVKSSIHYYMEFWLVSIESPLLHWTYLYRTEHLFTVLNISLPNCTGPT